MKEISRKTAPIRSKTGFDAPMQAVGHPSEHVTVLCAKALGAPGAALAKTILESAETVYGAVTGLFGVTDAPSVTILLSQLSAVSDGGGGAYHWACDDVHLYVDADLRHPNGAERALGLFAGELADICAERIKRGWNCNDPMGEALSRFVAELCFPVVLDDYSSAATWLDSSRRDFITSKPAGLLDDAAVGCGVLFFWWLVSQGISPATICRAGGENLAECYSRLSGKPTAATDFLAACEQKWPSGKPSGVQSDNPWGPTPTRGGPSGSRPGAPAGQYASANVVTMAAGLPPGTYIQIGHEMQEAVKGLGLSWQQILQIVAVLASFQGKPMTLETIMAMVAAVQQILAHVMLAKELVAAKPS